MKYIYLMCEKDYPEELTEPGHFIAGTEYEIEDVKNIAQYNGKSLPPLTHEPIEFGGYNWILDGSLRNNGIEVTTPPLSFEDSIQAFKHIHEIIETGPAAYSPRTSIHVHVNVLPWTTGKLYDFILLYALLEPVFFNMAPSRKHNINCVPLNYTILPQKYSTGAEHLIGCWSKYTAFNIKPVTMYGTVEFRHMYGTGDLSVYRKWLNMLYSLWAYVDTKPEGFMKNYITTYTPKQIAYQVFNPDVEVDLDYSQSLIDVKLAFV